MDPLLQQLSSPSAQGNSNVGTAKCWLDAQPMLGRLLGCFQGCSPLPAAMGGPGPSCSPGHVCNRQRGEHGHTFGAEERGVAGLVAEGLPIMLGREGSVRMMSGNHSSLGIASVPTGVQRPPWPCLHPKMHPACGSASDSRPKHSRISPASNTPAIWLMLDRRAGAPAPCGSSAERHLQAPTRQRATRTCFGILLPIKHPVSSQALNRHTEHRGFH